MSNSKNLSEPVDAVARLAFGRSRTAARALAVCVSCAKPPQGFRDTTSAREWEISSLCQECQDSVFGLGGDED
jgi:hypothetical protein